MVIITLWSMLAFFEEPTIYLHETTKKKEIDKPKPTGVEQLEQLKEVWEDIL